MSTATHGEGVETRDGVPVPGIIGEVAGVFAALRVALADFLDLLSLEARRAGLALMWMAICTIAAAACIVSAWLGLMAALIIWAVSTGFPLLAAAIVVAVMNGAVGAVLIYRCISLSRDLLFAATRRQLAGAPPATLAP